LNFGVLYPPAYCEAQIGADACSMTTECLIAGTVHTVLEVRLRFLQVQLRTTRRPNEAVDERRRDGWQEAVERNITLPPFPLETALFGPVTQEFRLPAQTLADADPAAGGVSRVSVERQQSELRGEIVITCQRIREDLQKIRVDVSNSTSLVNPAASRDDALLHSLVSAHIVLSVEHGEFLSLLEPPAELQELAAQCQNVGAWPVLVGEPGQRDTLLASPIILYDYPQIAPESAGDLFDGTEIDEILSLRIMTLTDEEKREIRESDERAREILDRTDAMPAEQFMKLHGAVRGLRPLKESTP
jgi:hydrogenase maturation protease